MGKIIVGTTDGKKHVFRKVDYIESDELFFHERASFIIEYPNRLITFNPKNVVYVTWVD